MRYTVKSLCVFPSLSRKRTLSLSTLGGPKCLHKLMNSLLFQRGLLFELLSVPKSFSDLHNAPWFPFQQYTTQVKGTRHAMQKYFSLQQHRCLFFLPLPSLSLLWVHCPSELFLQSHAGFTGWRQVAIPGYQVDIGRKHVVLHFVSTLVAVTLDLLACHNRTLGVILGSCLG